MVPRLQGAAPARPAVTRLEQDRTERGPRDISAITGSVFSLLRVEKAALEAKAATSTIPMIADGGARIVPPPLGPFQLTRALTGRTIKKIRSVGGESMSTTRRQFLATA